MPRTLQLQSGSIVDGLFKPGQWSGEISLTDESAAALGLPPDAGPIQMLGYKFRNPNPANPTADRFYVVQPGQYGQPLIHECGVIAPSANLKYRSRYGEEVAPPTTLIVGCIFKNEDHTPAVLADGKPPRFSFDNPDAPAAVKFLTDGTVELNGKVWHLRGLHACNKNRITGLVAFLYPTPSQSGAVTVDELVDVQYA